MLPGGRLVLGAFAICSFATITSARPLPYPSRYSEHERYDCINRLGVDGGHWQPLEHWSDRQKTLETAYVIEYGENGEHIRTVEGTLRNGDGDIIKVTKAWPNRCIMQILRCNLTENDKCIPGSIQKWRPGAWLSIPKPSKCPTAGNQTQVNTDGVISHKWSGKRHAKRAPTDAKCFMRKLKNNKKPTECGKGEDGKLVSLGELAQESAHYSEVPADNEADLILARGDGEFHWNDLHLENLFVCRKHRNDLGRHWKNKRPCIEKSRVRVGPKCIVPQIDGAISHVKPTKAVRDLYITKEESEALLIVKHVFVPLGTGNYIVALDLLANTLAHLQCTCTIVLQLPAGTTKNSLETLWQSIAW